MAAVHFKMFKGRTDSMAQSAVSARGSCTKAPAVKSHPVTAPRDATLSPCFWRVGMSMVWEPAMHPSDRQAASSSSSAGTELQRCIDWC